MLVLLQGVLILFGVLAVYFFLGHLWRRVYSLEPGYDQIHFAETSDGWKVALHRYSPKGGTARRYPAILCHGLGANRFNFDLGEGASLARFLQRQGYDVWVLELRGRGNSSRPRLCNRYRGTWHFDEYVRRDLPAAIALVKRLSGAGKVHWIGHSMGGIVLYAYLQGEGAHEIASGVAIGSPGVFRPLPGFSIMPAVMRVLGLLPRLHFEFLGAGIAPLLATGKAPFSRFFVNPENVEGSVLGRALCYLVSDIHSGELLQFADWMRHGEFRTFDRVYSYQEHLNMIRTPLFLMAGSMDFMAGPQSIAFVYDRLSSPLKRFRVCGRAYGDRYDYGHGDLLIGKACPQEVFPALVEWLEDVDKESHETEKRLG